MFTVLTWRYAVEEDSGVFKVLITDGTSVTKVEVSPVPAPEDPFESPDPSFPHRLLPFSHSSFDHLLIL